MADLRVSASRERSASAAAAASGHVGLLQKLVEGGADPWGKKAMADEKTPLQIACHHGHASAVTYLTSKVPLQARAAGALTSEEALNMGDGLGNTCAHLASLGGHAGILKKLVEARADLKKENGRSGTPLHAAASVGHLKVVHELLDLGADPCAKSAKGKTARALAEDEENDDVTKTLRRHEQAKGC